MVEAWKQRWLHDNAWKCHRETFLAQKNLESLPEVPESERAESDSKNRRDLRGFDFRGTGNWNYFSFVGCDMRGANFSGVNLRGACFTGTILDDADFSGADLEGANFTEARLRGGHFHSAQLKDANLKKADCQNASFFAASLFRANLTDADLRGAWFEGAILRDLDLKGARLDSADGFVRTDLMTRLPFRRLTWMQPPRAFLRDEVEGDYAAAERIYMQLQSLVREAGQREQAGELFYRARWCRRLALPRRTDRVWELWFKQWLIGFGERILRPIWVGILSIFVFAGLYWAAGNLALAPQRSQSTQSGVTNASKPVFLDCINYSAKTFTTLGYSDTLPDFSRLDIRPGFQRALWSWLPTFEAVTAACLVSLFAAIAFRKIVRD